MKLYSLGFLLDNNFKVVALIRKKRPHWQAGLWNGIGGHIEANETPLDCMVREFQEETKAYVEPSRWNEFAVLTDGKTFQVHVFYAAMNYDDLPTLHQTTDEAPLYWYTDVLPETIPNITWLIPMAKTIHEGVESASTFIIRET